MSQETAPGIGRILVERKALFAGVFLAFLAIVVLVTWRMPPVFEAKTAVLLDTNQAQDQISLVTGQNPFQPRSDTNNEIQTLRSRALAAAVARRLASDDPGNDASLGAGRSHRKLPSLRGLPGLPGLPADSLLRAAWILDHTTIRPLQGSDVVEIRAQASTPREAAGIANACADVYIEISGDRARSEVRRVREFLAEQVALVRDRLQGSETSLRDVRRQSNVASLEDETRALVEQVSTFEVFYNQARADLLAHQERLRLLQGRLDAAQSRLADEIPVVTGPIVNQLRAELADRMTYREKFLAQGYDPDHPKMQELEAEIGEIRARLAATVGEVVKGKDLPFDPLAQFEDLLDQILVEEVETSALQARVEALKGSMDEHARRLAGVPEKSYRMGQLAYNAEVDQKILAMLLQRYEEARIEEAGMVGTARIIDRASVPRFPVRPDWRLNLFFGVLLGGIVATFACLLADRLHHRVQSVHEASRLSGLAATGRIPAIATTDLKEWAVQLKAGPIRRARLRRKRKLLVASGSLILAMNPWSRTVEAFRSLRLALVRQSGPEAKCLVVTSPGLGDGKTMVSCNLALVLAGARSRVLLVDADQRRPQVARRFRVRPRYGLVDLLVGRIRPGEAIVTTSLHNLSLLALDGPAENPYDVLTSPRLAPLFEELRAAYDYVIVDAPPILPVADTGILSGAADATLLVVRARHSDCEALAHAGQVLRSLGVTIAGMVWNADPAPIGGKRYGGYYYHRPERRLLEATTGGSAAGSGASGAYGANGTHGTNGGNGGNGSGRPAEHCLLYTSDA
ncbi:MAG: polysaccharide biosynthesis tyrosine autokinase, partial [Candidatus Eisenbacteria bacterium]|nr:polysaccharide biosynthesis tyrosine autokinase [Candidatus Eisenbacteria bacterium]